MFFYNGKQCNGVYVNGKACPMYVNGIKIWPIDSQQSGGEETSGGGKILLSPNIITVNSIGGYSSQPTIIFKQDVKVGDIVSFKLDASNCSNSWWSNSALLQLVCDGEIIKITIPGSNGKWGTSDLIEYEVKTNNQLKIQCPTGTSYNMTGDIKIIQ